MSSGSKNYDGLTANPLINDREDDDDMGNFLLDDCHPPPGADVRRVLFDIFKSIIDGEWGPYEDDFYWQMVDEAIAMLGLTPEHRTGQDGYGGISHQCDAAGRIISTTRNGRSPTEMMRWVTAWNVSREPQEHSSTHVYDEPIAITSQQ